MSKKVQCVLWTVIAIIAILLLGLYVYNTVLRLNSGDVHPEISIEVENYGTIKMELYPEYAPNTVKNIIKLAECGYYDGKTIYGKDDICLYAGRDAEGNAINPTAGQIFDSVEIGSEDDFEYTISGEFVANGFKQNTLSFEKGIVSLIRNDYSQYFSNLKAESYDSGNAQLGIMMSDDCHTLNGVYTGFGRIIEGMDVLENIYANAEVQAHEDAEAETANEEAGIEAFANSPKIVSVKVDKKGESFGLPKVKKAFNYDEYLYNLMSQYYGQ